MFDQELLRYASNSNSNCNSNFNSNSNNNSNKLELSYAKLSLASAKLHTSLSSDKLKLATNEPCSTLLTKLAEAL